MVFYPDTPRWLLLQERDEEAFRALSKLRRVPADHPSIVSEALDIKASILLENTFTRDHYNGASGLKLHAAQVSPDLPHQTPSPKAHGLMIVTVSFSLHKQIPFPPPRNRLLRHVLPGTFILPLVHDFIGAELEPRSRKMSRELGGSPTPKMCIESLY
jgi:Sugar (and other) transporter